MQEGLDALQESVEQIEKKEGQPGTPVRAGFVG